MRRGQLIFRTIPVRMQFEGVVAASLAAAALALFAFVWYKQHLAKRKKFAEMHTPEEKDMIELTLADLARHNGVDASVPVYVAIKGIIYDVSTKRDSYGPGASYHVLAGKDASKALGMSSLDPVNCVADYSGLTAKQLETLNGWEKFFTDRYPRIGRVV